MLNLLVMSGWSAAAMLVSAHAAAFRNLNFDEAQTNHVIFYSPWSGGGSSSDLLPGWQLYQSESLQTNVWFDGEPVGSGGYAVVQDRVSPFSEGFYSVLLDGPVPFSLVQQGGIPVGAAFLKYHYQENTCTVSINGSLLPVLRNTANSIPALQGITQEIVYNISSFAGEDVELRLM
jgi:hypothetical protein